MSKREDLKRKLKASDRRRSRRSATAASTPSTAGPTPAKQTPTVDVAGLVATTILEYAEASGADVVDAAVVSAMKGSLKATVPSGQHSRQLWYRLDRLAHQEHVEMKAFRNAVHQMLETASAHQDPENSHAFLRYLSLIAE